MDSVLHAEAAELLLQAYDTRVPVDPLVDKYDGLTLDDAYEIQLMQVNSRLAAGGRVKGHKVGLTSRAMQRQLGVDQPDYGHLLDGMFHVERTPIPIGRFLQPRIEPEVAFVLGRRLEGPGVTVAEAVAAVEFVVPALEIIDSRIRDWKIGLLDTVADNASSGGVVLGSTPTQPSAVDLRLAGCNLVRNGELAGTGAGGAVLGSPISAVVWLANTLGAWGVALEAGHVVLPGSMTAAVPVAGGDTVTASVSGLGNVTGTFSREGE